MKSPVVFISATNADYSAAREVYQFLAGRGIDSFFCDESLLRVGEKGYRAKADRALADAGRLIVVAGSRTHAESEWVRHAWTEFSRRPDGAGRERSILTVLCGGLEGADLPRVLRRGRTLRFPEELDALEPDPGSPLDPAGAAAGNVSASGGRRHRRMLAIVTLVNAGILAATVWLLRQHGVFSRLPGPLTAEQSGTTKAASNSSQSSPIPGSSGEWRAGEEAGTPAGAGDAAAARDSRETSLAERRPVYPDAGTRPALDLWETPAAGTPLPVSFGGAVKQTFCFIPAGSFLMGSPPEEQSRDDDENQHRVTLTRPFWLASTECTRGLWYVITGEEAPGDGTPRHPVHSVSWAEIAGDRNSFLSKLNTVHPLPPPWRFALPTEAQWEYACRAGTTTPFSFGAAFDRSRANCDGWHIYGSDGSGKFTGGTTPAGSYAPNAWGLFDMHGNVWEWCADRYAYSLPDATDPLNKTGSGQVRRGGSWRFNAGLCRSASREGVHPDVGDDTLGFRLAIVSTAE